MSSDLARVSFLLLACLHHATTGWAQEAADPGWPRQIDVPGGTVVVYQPQPQSLKGNRLEARAAVAVEIEGSEPVFGVVWFDARLDTDRAERTATIADVAVTQVRFPVQDEEKKQRLSTLLEEEIVKWDLPISLDRLLTTLELAEQRAEAAQRISTDAPRILFVPEPAVLITLDGEPRLQREGDTGLMRVINTPFTILLVPAGKTYYLNADAETWYQAGTLDGDWRVATRVPREVSALAPAPEPDDGESPEDDELEPGPPPKVMVATAPTELISSTGAPEYTPISGTELLYISNTDSDVLLHLSNQQHYVLLAGRWYAASSLEGPWLYVPGDELPADFAGIPEDSQMGTVLYAVPGTDIAREAVMDAQIPQTATVERDQASLAVEYDGEPEFEDISGTEMSYGINTATPIIAVGSEYYACDDAVWFVAGSATGPWRVATSVPQVIYTIPPDSPVYQVTHVYIYDATPQVVYVGYTPGYTGTYVYNTTIVYGTGYYYPGWYRRYYYPRYSTWGFHVRYNPWTGWGFGRSYSSGPFRFTIGYGGWYRGGWWGPGRYRGYRRGYRHGYRRGRNAGYRAGYRSGRRNAANNNMYRSQRNQTRVSATTPSGRDRARGTAAAGRANNVYADRDGNVHRRTDQGWQSRTGDGWQSKPSQRPESRPSQQPQAQPSQRPTTQPSQQRTQQSGRSSYSAGGTSRTQQLDRSHQARQRGTQRTQSYNRSRSGGRRGGRRR